jgi:DNA processing protein
MTRIVKITDKEYPEILKTIHKPPERLYINGSFTEADKNAVAIVGSRRATAYGLETAERLGFELASRGVTVTSGMARGIDSAAHKGALRARGRTIAVMGSGHGHVYPPENKQLYNEITASGAVVTEFADDVAPLAQNFPVRNRIISGLSLGVVIVEAARNSGALITANFALEQGREIFAVPGRISSSTSAGTHDLIKDGAKLVQTADDILEELLLREIRPLSGVDREPVDAKIAKSTKAYIYNSLTDDERKIYKILSDEPLHIDDVALSSGLDIAGITKVLLSLQMKRLAKELPGKTYIRT